MRKGRANLYDSGTMLGAIKAVVLTARHGQIFVGLSKEPKSNISSTELAMIHNDGRGPQPQREFMNLNDTQVAKLKKKHWDDKLLEMTRRLR
jgi:hypothetical protein